MIKNKLGKSDLQVSAIGFGCMSIHKSLTFSGVNLIIQAYEGGVNYFDTADLYDHGWNEEFVGKAVSSFRQDILLATKVGNQWRADGSGWDWKASKPYIIQTVETSLSRLNTDYIDLYQLHGGTIDDPIDEIIEAFEQLVDEGKIRYYGLSSIRPNVIREYAERSNITSVMMQYNLLDHRPEETVLDELLKKNISVVTRGTIAKGLLINKTAEAYLQFTAGEVQHAARHIAKIAEEKQVSPLSIAMGYVLQHPAVASAIMGIRTKAQLNEILEASENLESLSVQDRIRLRQETRPFLYSEHR
ncbi:aldo/keto reductase [Sphingobacterium spiritivorum]|uniref:Oxidoreductase, aldo/keto reductase family protein n=1 Tax=Sphingobacterium spiritivorum ATCC 33861 TaxID=525373 RepID=D7VQA9_SPHSI|nr:aldo/keto reductase [Sphingobacterium spiritivorum]EFK55960.1 oxidoreductase, aldo/keto reductase family protein [Sphingobacterium spiritivorum ATCC 33861]QQT35906.1 aldo/keto reductase [Sphingobacterium spiritivorum]WQD32634.1 aldo/keto reductase [Sphingobacterium spiritivorum]SUJ12185.1 putative oxidoreductase [Sphingobacterium spiritivorum]